MRSSARRGATTVEEADCARCGTLPLPGDTNDYRPALAAARRHAEATGHTVRLYCDVTVTVTAEGDG